MEKDILIKIVNDVGNIFYERKSNILSLNFRKKSVILTDKSSYLDVVNLTEIVRIFNK